MWEGDSFCHGTPFHHHSTSHRVGGGGGPGGCDQGRGAGGAENTIISKETHIFFATVVETGSIYTLANTHRMAFLYCCWVSHHTALSVGDKGFVYIYCYKARWKIMLPRPWWRESNSVELKIFPPRGPEFSTEFSALAKFSGDVPQKIFEVVRKSTTFRLYHLNTWWLQPLLPYILFQIFKPIFSTPHYCWPLCCCWRPCCW